jgi:tripartite-type tricarboxylate transporter receptor subunit TctC
MLSASMAVSTPRRSDFRRRQRRHRAGLAAAVLALLMFAAAGGYAQAQELKSKTIRMVVPFPPGGTADNIARLITQQANTTGFKLIVENRPGAGTIIATDLVAHATPDGTSLLIMSNSFVINTIVRAKLPYDPFTLEPICLIADSPQVIVVHQASPYRTLKDLIEAARAKPGALSFAAVGPATTQHIAGEMLKQAANVNLTYVPFTGGAPAVNALLGQHVTTVIANYNEVMEQLKAGNLRALAVASRQRLKAIPDVPTFIEAGYKDFEASAFFGVVTTAGTPKDTVAQLDAMLTAALKDPGVSAKLVAQGLDMVGACGETFRAHIKRQHEIYTRAIQDAGIKIE